VDPHRLAEERSIALHRAVAAKLRAHPELVERARQRTETWRATGAVHEAYIAAWEELLRLPLEELCARMVDPGEGARALRQVSVFAGVLDPRERWRIRKSVP
jgi:hypothetical protein